MWCETCPKDCPYKTAYLKKNICNYSYIADELRDCPVEQNCKRYNEWVERGRPNVIDEYMERKNNIKNLKENFIFANKI